MQELVQNLSSDPSISSIERRRHNPPREVQTMNAELSKKYELIKQLIKKAEHADIRNRYKVALHLRDVNQGDGQGQRYGNGAVREIATTLGWGKSTVHEYIQVAEAWNEEQLETVIKKGEACGQPLTWGHLCVIAAVADTEERGGLVDDTIRNGLSMQELKRRRQSRTEPQETDAVTAPVRQTLPPSLATAIRSYAAQVAVLKSNVDTWGAQLVDQIAHVAPEQLSAEVLDQLRQINHGLKESFEVGRRQLDSCMAAIEKRLNDYAHQRDDREDADVSIAAFRPDDPESSSTETPGAVA
jgi:hypothetical protein